MKVAIQCDSPLLQRSLELFLEGQLSPIRQCDILIRDKEIRDENHPTLIIGSSATADLTKPFSKGQLLQAIAQKASSLRQTPVEEMAKTVPGSEEGEGFERLQRHIEQLTREYQESILKAVRTFYEK